MIKDKFQYLFRWIQAVCEINTYRRFFTGRVKIRVFLSSGQHVDISATEWNCTYRGGSLESWQVTGAAKQFNFNPKDIIAWREK